MTTPLVGVLALQGDVREHIAAFERCGCRTMLVRLPEDLEAVDALSLPGGESTTMGRLLRVYGFEESLRRRLAGGLPCFATCAGMILLSRDIVDGRPDQPAFGALDLAVRRNGYGRQVDSFEEDVDVPAIGDPPFRGVFIRAPRITEVGSATVVATIHGEPVGVRQGTHLALAFHPEMTRDDRLHRLFLSQIQMGSASAA